MIQFIYGLVMSAAIGIAAHNDKWPLVVSLFSIGVFTFLAMIVEGHREN